jgi:chaperonin GroEL
MSGGAGLKNVVIRSSSPDLLHDIASVVGATVIGGQGGVSFDKITPIHLGKADKVVVSEKKSLFFSKSSKALKQSKRLEELGKNTDNVYEKRKYLERAAKLRGKIAVIKVGAPTDTEKWYLKEKLEDAVNATQSAIEEGYVEGGGMCLYRIAEKLNPKTVGEEILKKVLTAPLRTILENAGKDYVEVVKNMPKGKGYNARTGEYINLIKEGIIDPTKVERCALENAVSTGGTFLTMKYVIVDLPQKNGKEN